MVLLVLLLALVLLLPVFADAVVSFVLVGAIVSIIATCLGVVVADAVI